LPTGAQGLGAAAGAAYAALEKSREEEERMKIEFAMRPVQHGEYFKLN